MIGLDRSFIPVSSLPSALGDVKRCHLSFPVFHGLYFSFQSEPPGTHAHDHHELSVSSLVPVLLSTALIAISRYPH
ncbi:hypothetical protein BDR03DRAFT_952849 [Suillus americanus]|nr:hypothetical protein BDR03DRAFT_952849 [Suillus americanus]